MKPMQLSSAINHCAYRYCGESTFCLSGTELVERGRNPSERSECIKVGNVTVVITEDRQGLRVFVVGGEGHARNIVSGMIELILKGNMEGILDGTIELAKSWGAT